MKKKISLQCGCMALILIVNALAGGWSVNYLLDLFFSKMIPFFWATAIGLFVGEFSIPVAIIAAILKHYGVF